MRNTITHQLELVAYFKLLNSPILSIDIETTGLLKRKDKIIGIGLSDGTDSVYLTHLTWEDEQLAEKLPYNTMSELLQRLADKQIKLVTYNGAFDLPFIKNYFKVDLVPLLHADSMLLFHTLQEEGVPFSHKPFALKSVGAFFYGDDVVQDQHDMKESIKRNGGTANEFYKADLEPMSRYCQMDAELTIRLFQDLTPRLKDENLMDFFFEREVMPLYREVTIPMENGGLPLDLPLIQSSLTEINIDLFGLSKSIFLQIKPLLGPFEEWFLDKDYPPKRTGPFAQAVVELLGPDSLPKTESGAYSLAAKGVSMLPDGLLKSWLSGECLLSEDIVRQAQWKAHGDAPMFNLLSKHHLKKLFFDTLGETPLSRTETGLPQVDDEFLESVSKKYSWVPLLQDYNKLTKIKGTYIERFLEEQDDGVFYPSFFQHRTISGRYGSNLQQLPRPLEKGQASDLVIKYNNRIRHFFKAKPGYKFVGADYESLEPKVFAHASTDAKLQAIFQKGEDFYSRICIDVEGLTEYSAEKNAPNYLGKVNKSKRQEAKVYALGVVYGMTGYKLQFELNISQEEADAKVAAYLAAYPDLHTWMQDSQAKAYTQGFVTVETGRKRRFQRAVKIYNQYGDVILNDLELWKAYHKEPQIYAQAKKHRREFKNSVNNATNLQIQGLAASIVNLAGIEMTRRLTRAGLKSRLCLQTHDEWTLYAPDEEVEQASKIMQEVMEQNYKITVPLVAIPQAAQTYGGTK